MKTRQWMAVCFVVIVVAGGGIWWSSRSAPDEQAPGSRRPETGEVDPGSRTDAASTEQDAPEPEEDSVIAGGEESDPDPLLQAETLEEDPTPDGIDSFSDWRSTAPPGDPAERKSWMERGVALANERRARMEVWVREDPEKALEVALTPRQAAQLPDVVRARVERPVSEEGFYGVMAICTHGAGAEHDSACEIKHEVVLHFGTHEAEAMNASIFGEREEKMTEEQAAINGVALDGHLAMYPDDVVVLDEGPEFGDERYGIYHKGLAGTAPTREAAEQLARELIAER